ncbi:MAG: response regulator [Deltaproteobacteria bacterium]|nr:response regulator [Deltaproteobacteria bacterium]
MGEHDFLTELIGRALVRLGCSCDCARNGPKAVGLSRAVKYDAILIETCEQSPDGLEFLRGLREAGVNAGTPVLVVSCHPLDPEEFTREHGVQGYVAKPFSVETLLERVAALLGCAVSEEPPPAPPGDGGRSHPARG